MNYLSGSEKVFAYLKMFKLRTSLLAVTIVLLFETVISENVRGSNDTNEFPENERSRVLSRRKRFIIFPDGSSLQLGR